MGNETPPESIIRILREKAHPPQVRLDAILYMVEGFVPEYVPVFQEILDDPAEHPDIRSAIALALAKVGRRMDRGEMTGIANLTENDILAMLLARAGDTDPTVRNYAIQGLGMLGRVEAAPALIEALKDKSNVIFASAAEALGSIGKPVVPHLIQLLDHGADDARCIAAWQLGQLRYVDAIPALIKVIREDANTEVMALSIWALGEIGFGPKEVLEILNWAKEQEDPDIHERARRAIKKIARHCN